MTAVTSGGDFSPHGGVRGRNNIDFIHLHASPTLVSVTIGVGANSSCMGLHTQAKDIVSIKQRVGTQCLDLRITAFCQRMSMTRKAIHSWSLCYDVPLGCDSGRSILN